MNVKLQTSCYCSFRVLYFLTVKLTINFSAMHFDVNVSTYQQYTTYNRINYQTTNYHTVMLSNDTINSTSLLICVNQRLLYIFFTILYKFAILKETAGN